MFDFVILLLFTAVAQLAGGVLSYLFVKKFCRNLKTIVFIEIALMLFVSLLLIEEGLKVTLLATLSLLVGVSLFAVLNKVIPHKHETETERIGFLVFIAMCFHEFPEGIAFGASYMINPLLGVTTAIVIALHNIPEGLIVSFPYAVKGSLKGFRAVLITQILYVLGGLSAYYLLLDASEQLQALSITFAAGAMLYIIFEEYLLMKKHPECLGGSKR